MKPRHYLNPVIAASPEEVAARMLRDDGRQCIVTAPVCEFRLQKSLFRTLEAVLSNVPGCHSAEVPGMSFHQELKFGTP